MGKSTINGPFSIAMLNCRRLASLDSFDIPFSVSKLRHAWFEEAGMNKSFFRWARNLGWETDQDGGTTKKSWGN
jgi:hypothetical protein